MATRDLSSEKIKPPRSLKDLFWLVVERFPRTLMKNLPLIIFGFIIILALNLVGTIFIDQGTNEILGYTINTVIITAVLGGILIETYEGVKGLGVKNFIASLQTVSSSIKHTKKQLGSISNTIIILGFIIPFFWGIFVSNIGFMTAFGLAYGLFLAIASKGDGLLFALIPLAVSDFQTKILKKDSTKLFSLGVVNLIIFGIALGLLLTGLTYSILSLFNFSFYLIIRGINLIIFIGAGWYFYTQAKEYGGVSEFIEKASKTLDQHTIPTRTQKNKETETKKTLGK